jgi:hypothetical protein
MDMRIRDVPDDLQWRFKLMCTEMRTSMNKRVIELVRKDVEKYEREKEKRE